MTAHPLSAGLDCLIVDDEALARQGIRALLDAEAAGSAREAPGGAEAVRMIRDQRPDLVFLDVQMPRVDGFSVIEAIGPAEMPPVIFVTAHDEHAVRAFEVNAVDYLLKPIDPERFRDAVDRARAQASHDDLATLRTAYTSLMSYVRSMLESAPAGRAAPPKRLAVHDRGRIQFVSAGEIDWIETQGNYVELHLGSGTHLRHRATMDAMVELLGPEFVRIRRSTLVRVAAIRFCEPWGKGSYVLVLHDHTRLTSSRHFRAQLAGLIDR